MHMVLSTGSAELDLLQRELDLMLRAAQLEYQKEKIKLPAGSQVAAKHVKRAAPTLRRITIAQRM